MVKFSSSKFAFGVAAILVVLAPLAASQQEPSLGPKVSEPTIGDLTSSDPTISSRANLVPVPTLVEDAKGNVIYGLRAEDFEIEDDGVAQAAHLDATPDAEPVSLMIAVQVGRRANREFPRIRGLASMLDPVLTAPNTEAAVLLFDKELNLVRDFTDNADEVKGDLQHLEHGDGGAAIFDAVAYSAKLLNKRAEGRQRVLLLISETRDHGSHFSNLDEVVKLIEATNTTVYALPFSPYESEQLDGLRGADKDEWHPGMDLLAKLVAARNALKKNAPRALTSMTGGDYESFLSQKSFEKEMVNFSNHLHGRYALSFAPKNPHPGLHEIRVRVKDTAGNVTVISRKSYWVDDSR